MVEQDMSIKLQRGQSSTSTVATWPLGQLAVFDSIGRINIVFANTGISKPHDYFSHESVAEGKEHSYTNLIGPNIIGILHTLTLIQRSIRVYEVKEGSVVVLLA